MSASKTTRDIKTIQARNIKALELRPKIGRGTATTTVRLRKGQVASDVYDGGHHLVVDMGVDSGGENVGPDPGILIRGGLGACLASGYRLWAEYMDVPLDEVEVVIEADYDARGMYGVGDEDRVPPGYIALRARVNITSDAPEERVREMVEHADRHSPLLYDLTTALSVTRETTITAPVK